MYLLVCVLSILIAGPFIQKWVKRNSTEKKGYHVVGTFKRQGFSSDRHDLMNVILIFLIIGMIYWNRQDAITYIILFIPALLAIIIDFIKRFDPIIVLDNGLMCNKMILSWSDVEHIDLNDETDLVIYSDQVVSGRLVIKKIEAPRALLTAIHTVYEAKIVYEL
jgi:uncharacterized membrane protein YobD (UPF0266 family)